MWIEMDLIGFKIKTRHLMGILRCLVLLILTRGTDCAILMTYIAGFHDRQVHGTFLFQISIIFRRSIGEVGIWAYGRDITCSERLDSRKIIRHMGWR